MPSSTGQPVTHAANTLTACSEKDCTRPIYREKEGLCKHHYCYRVKKLLRLCFKRMYRGPEYAWSTLDFTGRGYILREDILNNAVSKQLQSSAGITVQEVNMMFDVCNVFQYKEEVCGDGFTIPATSIGYDQFKKQFFPHLYIVDEERQSNEDRDLVHKKRELHANAKSHPKVLESRVLALEARIKEKFKNQFQKVRKAFLLLDQDYDGFVDVEDMLRFLGNDVGIDYDDLKKLITDKDS